MSSGCLRGTGLRVRVQRGCAPFLCLHTSLGTAEQLRYAAKALASTSPTAPHQPRTCLTCASSSMWGPKTESTFCLAAAMYTWSTASQSTWFWPNLKVWSWPWPDPCACGCMLGASAWPMPACSSMAHASSASWGSDRRFRPGGGLLLLLPPPPGAESSSSSCVPSSSALTPNPDPAPAAAAVLACGVDLPGPLPFVAEVLGWEEAPGAGLVSQLLPGPSDTL